jgi:hypothetical protein
MAGTPQPRISALGHRPKVDPNASQRRKDRERFAISNCPLGQGQGRRLIRSPVVVQLSLHLSSGSGSPAQSSRLPWRRRSRSILTASTAARDIVKSPCVLSVSAVARRQLSKKKTRASRLGQIEP